MTTAIVFSSDEAYVFLARGLVLSLLAAGFPNADVRLVLIDIGCSPEALAWMRAHRVEIVPCDDALIPPKVMSLITPARRAQVIRPWLPQLLPQFDHFIWLDCDLWLQDGRVVNMLRSGARVYPEVVMLAPGISHYHPAMLTEIDNILGMQRGWYRHYYQDDFAEQISKRMHYSSGVFGMRRTSGIWDLWQKEIEYLYPLVAARDTRLIHLAEQTALNVVIFRTSLLLRLDPLFNFHCNGGGAMRTEDGRVVTNMLYPPQELGVIHLANWGLLKHRYVEMQILYRNGDYLSHTEWAAINTP